MRIAPELLARFNKFAAAKREEEKGPFSTQMLMLNALEQVDSKCYCLLDTGANALVLPGQHARLRSAMYGTGGSVVPGMVAQAVVCDGEEYHAVATEGASPLLPLSWLILLAGWQYFLKVDKGRMCVSIQSLEGVVMS